MGQIWLRVNLMRISPASPAARPPVWSPHNVLGPRLWPSASASWLSVWPLVSSPAGRESSPPPGFLLTSRVVWPPLFCRKMGRVSLAFSLLTTEPGALPSRPGLARHPNVRQGPGLSLPTLRTAPVSTTGALLTWEAPQLNPHPRATFPAMLSDGEGTVSDSPCLVLFHFGVRPIFVKTHIP